MSASPSPAHHPDQEIDAAHGYIADAARMLAARGLQISATWLDSKGPIDATIITGEEALVWDEWTGWRVGTYVTGRRGVRTALKDARRLGGCVLPSRLAIGELLPSGSALPLVTRERDARDGLFDALRRF